MPNTNTADISSAYSPIVTQVLAYIRDQKRPVNTEEIQSVFGYERKEMNCVRRELQKLDERGGAIRKIITPCPTTVLYVEGENEVDRALQLVSQSAITGSTKAVEYLATLLGVPADEIRCAIEAHILELLKTRTEHA